MLGIFGSPATAPPSELSSLALTSSGNKTGSEGSDKNHGLLTDVVLGAKAAPATRTTVVSTNDAVMKAFAAPTQTQKPEHLRSSRAREFAREFVQATVTSESEGGGVSSKQLCTVTRKRNTSRGSVGGASKTSSTSARTRETSTGLKVFAGASSAPRGVKAGPRG